MTEPKSSVAAVVSLACQRRYCGGKLSVRDILIFRLEEPDCLNLGQNTLNVWPVDCLTCRRSGGQFLDKQDFLKRAELREYEKERDKRLASDVRNRGRL